MSAKAWQPLEVEPDTIELALCDIVRSAILPVGTTAVSAPDFDGVRSTVLPDGRVVRAALRSEPAAAIIHGERAALSYAVAGNAVVDQRSMRFLARAVLDRQTRAFLDIAIDVQNI
ncbi:hypothetical protein [Segnochrobactrum spirostomi]|uniref:Uncharacterized protein n=1 Tax=Segnochrobactrum spirostomi TaxID=2608987 RepID=A0A6A7Y6Z9_9HYPH|nr:hypothetical protein [Segnochrobactrum spirostomi]MQT15054.1 hypothetical protein [Segnochrobactrum spirostomi]